MLLTSLVQNVYAVGGAVTPPTIGNIASLADVFGIIINVALGVGVALTVIFLILGGIQYIMSKGDQKAAQQARDWLTNAIIGFVVVVGAFTIKKVVSTMIDINTGALPIDVVDLGEDATP